ncbi:MAG: hypothetical protein FWH41_10525 [Treponema sp.]|nr:hypothetical protein [Treponema sp.]
MTFIDVITSLVLISVFLFGFSQVFLPVFSAWNRAAIKYSTVKTINFIAESFRNECIKPDRNIENWEKMAGSAKEMESYAITEIIQDEVLRALKLTCIIAGESLEIIGLCTP